MSILLMLSFIYLKAKNQILRFKNTGLWVVLKLIGGLIKDIFYILFLKRVDDFFVRKRFKSQMIKKGYQSFKDFIILPMHFLKKMIIAVFGTSLWLGILTVLVGLLCYAIFEIFGNGYLIDDNRYTVWFGYPFSYREMFELGLGCILLLLIYLQEVKLLLERLVKYLLEV